MVHTVKCFHDDIERVFVSILDHEPCQEQKHQYKKPKIKQENNKLFYHFLGIPSQHVIAAFISDRSLNVLQRIASTLPSVHATGSVIS